MEKVPLNVGWLSENGLLEKAAELLGYTVKRNSATKVGVSIQFEAGKVLTTVGTRRKIEEGALDWDNFLLFTVAQLLELGFEPGKFEYCEHCKRLKVDCDRELNDMWDREHAEG